MKRSMKALSIEVSKENKAFFIINQEHNAVYIGKQLSLFSYAPCLQNNSLFI
jgi:hypothetical protein